MDAHPSTSPLVPPHARSLRPRACWPSSASVAVGEVRLAGVAQGLRGVDGRGCGGRGDARDARVVRRRLGLSAAVSVQPPDAARVVVVVALPCSWLAVEMKRAKRAEGRQ